MLPPLLAPEERAFVASFAERWLALSSAENERDELGELFNPRDLFIDTLIHDFFNMFPYRDTNNRSADGRAFPIAVRDTLHSRMKRILYSEVAKLNRANEQQDDEYIAFGRFITFRTLFKQRYRDAIIARRDTIFSESQEYELFEAYNLAVEAELQRMTAEAPGTLDELKRLAVEIRSCAKRRFEEQPPEIQDILAAGVMASMQAFLKDLEHRTAAQVYVVVASTDSSGVMDFMDFTTKKSKSFLKSDESKALFTAWQNWISHTQGVGAGLHVAKPKPEIYPGPDGAPHFPSLAGFRVTMDEEKRLHRRFMSCWSQARGGGKLPYTRISKEDQEHPGTWVEPTRLPSGVTCLTDMSSWSRKALNAWRTHHYMYQSGELPASRGFRLNQIIKAGTNEIVPLKGSDHEEFKASRIIWTTLELKFKQYLEDLSDTEGSTSASALLPLARTSHIYAAFSIDTFRALNVVHAAHPELMALLKDVCVMESEGPIHCTTPLSLIGLAPSVHVPSAGWGDGDSEVVPAKWLRAAFWDPNSRAHVTWSIETFGSWVSKARPHVHHATGTVFGGPHGVRNLAFALSRVLQNVARAAVGKAVPRDISRHLSVEQLAIVQEKAVEIIELIRDDIACSRQILQKSLRHRQENFKAEIKRLQRTRLDDAALEAIGPTTAPTSRCPRSRDVLEEMFDILMSEQVQELDNGEDPEYIVTERLQQDVTQLEETMERIEITAILGDFDSEEDEPDTRDILSGLTDPTPPASIAVLSEDVELPMASSADQNGPRRSGRKSLKTARFEEAMVELRRK